MLTTARDLRKPVAKLSDTQFDCIYSFLQGAIYSFCNNCQNADGSNKYFTAIDLVGRKNTLWSNTPLQSLYEWHNTNRPEDAHVMAGKDIGWILLRVIHDDKRSFDVRDDYLNNAYCWTGEDVDKD